MNTYHVLIEGNVLTKEQAAAVKLSVELLFNRTTRFLRDYSHWKEERIKKYVSDYLHSAEVLRAFDPNWSCPNIVFVAGVAQLVKPADELFGNKNS